MAQVAVLEDDRAYASHLLKSELLQTKTLTAEVAQLGTQVAEQEAAGSSGLGEVYTEEEAIAALEEWKELRSEVPPLQPPAVPCGFCGKELDNVAPPNGAGPISLSGVKGPSNPSRTRSPWSRRPAACHARIVEPGYGPSSSPCTCVPYATLPR